MGITSKLREGQAGAGDVQPPALGLSSRFCLFFCFISVKNLALLYEVSFFSALLMVLPES